MTAPHLRHTSYATSIATVATGGCDRGCRTRADCITFSTVRHIIPALRSVLLTQPIFLKNQVPKQFERSGSSEPASRPPGLDAVDWAESIHPCFGNRRYNHGN